MKRAPVIAVAAAAVVVASGVGLAAARPTPLPAGTDQFPHTQLLAADPTPVV